MLDKKLLTVVVSDAEPSCILVVEDEFLIRLLVCTALRDAGWKAIEARSADEAVALLETDIKVDLIVSDVRMPGMRDGLDLLAFARHRFPEIPFVIMSAHLKPSDVRSAGALRFLPKPFGLDEVRDVVGALLAERSS